MNTVPVTGTRWNIGTRWSLHVRGRWSPKVWRRRTVREWRRMVWSHVWARWVSRRLVVYWWARASTRLGGRFLRWLRSSCSHCAYIWGARRS